MSEELKEVLIVFNKGDDLKLKTADPEALLQTITNQDTGWFRYEDIVIKRDRIAYAGIANSKSKVRVSQKPYGM